MPQSHAHWTSDLLLWSSVLLTEATKLRYCETLPGDLSPSILQQGQGVQDPTDHREISSLQKATRNSCSIETKSSSRCPVLISALFPLSLSLSLSLLHIHSLTAITFSMMQININQISKLQNISLNFKI